MFIKTTPLHFVKSVRMPENADQNNSEHFSRSVFLTNSIIQGQMMITEYVVFTRFVSRSGKTSISSV